MKRLVASICLSLLWATAAQGLVFENGGSYNPARHDRFVVGSFPTAPVPNPTFLLASYEDQLRGVGWQTDNPKKKVALITPQHFLTANHFKAKESISFLDDQGNVQTFPVASITGGFGDVFGDLAIGTLEAPIPKELGIRPFPVAQVKGDGPWGREVYYVGNAPGSVAFCVGRTGFEDVLNGNAHFNSKLVTGTDYRDRVKAVAGDSGAPSFFLAGDRLILIGHHYTENEDVLLGSHDQQVNVLLRQSGYSLDLQKAPSRCGDGAGQGAAMVLVLAGWTQTKRRKK